MSTNRISRRTGDAADDSLTADGEQISEGDARRLARDEVLISAIAQGASYSEAAAQARCTSRTVARRMTEPVFRAQVDERRSEWVSATSGGLTALGPRAVQVLTEILQSESPVLQLRAVREVLAQGFRSRQLHELEGEMREIRAELEALRQAQVCA